MVERGTRQDKPMKPQVVAHELNKLLADDAIVATDSGTITTWIARHLTHSRGDEVFLLRQSRHDGLRACPMPWRPRSRYPGRQVVAFVGDGGLTMLIGELATCVKYDLDVKIVVIKNNVLGQIKWEQMVFLGNPEYVCELQPIDFAAVGARLRRQELHHRRSGTLRRDAASGAVHQGSGRWSRRSSTRTNRRCRRRSRFKEAKNFAEALVRGTPARGKIALTVASDTVRELI